VTDPYAGLADPAYYAKNNAAFTPDKNPPSNQALAEQAVALEQAIRAVPGVTNIDMAEVTSVHARHVMATSNGFAGQKERSHTTFSADAIAQTGEQKFSHDEIWSALHAADLPDIATFAQLVGQTVVAQTKAGKIEKSGVMPVVLHPRIASVIVLDNLVDSLDALAMHESKSWIKREHLGQRLANEAITGTYPRGWAAACLTATALPGQSACPLWKRVYCNTLW
jgi:PmbA protein